MPTYLTPGVYVEEVPSGSMPLTAAGTAVAAFIGYTAKAPADDPRDPEGQRPRMVTNWTQYKRLYGGFTNSALLPQAVYGFFQNGGGRCYIVRIPHRKSARGELPQAADGAKTLEFVSLAEDAALTVEVEPNAIPKDKPDTKPTFDVKVSRDAEVKEHFKELSLGKGPRNAATVINEVSSLIEVITAVDDATLPVKAQKITLDPPAAQTVAVDTFNGDAERREGVEGLVIADDVTMVMVPDLWTAAKNADGTDYDRDMWVGVQKAVIAHCQNEANRMAILDTPPDLNAQQVRAWSDSVGYDSKFATLYYPWLKVDNPAGTNGNKTIAVPPCGHMAGIWARSDATRGVWKAPANETVLSAIDVVEPITKLEQELLNPEGINAIRSFGSRGLKVWGARTLSKTDPSWRYINVRRLFNMIETTIMDGTQWVVFEPNDQALWQRVNRTVSSFLLGLWRDGALFGATPDEAFFVKCDRETNPPESIDEGKLVVEVGIAPVKPAEFVIFRISQKTLSGTA
jgi:phage tail sheath protein FI